MIIINRYCSTHVSLYTQRCISLLYKAFRLLLAYSIQMLAHINYLSSLFTTRRCLHVFQKLAAPQEADGNKFILKTAYSTQKNDTMWDHYMTFRVRRWKPEKLDFHKTNTQTLVVDKTHQKVKFRYTADDSVKKKKKKKKSGLFFFSFK